MRFAFKSCRIRIRTVVGTRANGTASTRSFSIKHIREDVTPDQAAAVVRAIAAVLDREIASAHLVREYEPVEDAPMRAASAPVRRAVSERTATPTADTMTAQTAAPVTAPAVPNLAALLSREPLYVSELLAYMDTAIAAGAGYIDTSREHPPPLGPHTKF